MNINKLKIIYVCFLIITACGQDLAKKHQSWIKGEWYPVDLYKITGENFNMTGYEFKEGGICENKLGYYEYYNNHAFSFSDPYKIIHDYFHPFELENFRFHNVLYSYGTTTGYSIKRDSLYIFNPSLRGYEKFKVNFISKDTMMLTNDSRVELYIRKNYCPKDSLLFDKIIFLYPYTQYRSPTFFSISKDGDYFRYDLKSTGEIFHAKILKEDFRNIEFLFRKANFDALMDSIGYKSVEVGMYYTSESIAKTNMTVVLNHKMFSIEGVLREIEFEVKDFIWAYLNGVFYLERIRLEQPANHRYLKEWKSMFPENIQFEDFNSFVIIKNDSIIDLHNMEAFHLVTLLNDAVKTEDDFTPTYKLKKSFFLKNEVETDGRYFRYKKEGEVVTVDLGFNFVSESDLERFLRAKNYREREASDEKRK